MPPRKPKNIKLLTGTYRPSRDNPNAPEPERGTPDVPEWLGESARRFWGELTPQLEAMRVLTPCDRTALGLLADTLAEYHAARAVVQKEGQTYAKGSRGRKTLRRAVPELEIARQARRDALRLLVEFGLTPASRPRVSAEPKRTAEDEAWDRYFGPKSKGA